MYWCNRRSIYARSIDPRGIDQPLRDERRSIDAKVNYRTDTYTTEVTKNDCLEAHAV
jgi:hypothetical protein